VPLGASEADVQQPALLFGVGRRTARAERQLLVQQPGQEHRLELEPLRAVERREVHASRAPIGGEAARELGDEGGDIARGIGRRELRSERPEAREVRLPRDLFGVVGLGVGVVADGVGRLLDGLDNAAPGAAEAREHGPGPGAAQERAVAHLVRDPGGRERLLERL